MLLLLEPETTYYHDKRITDAINLFHLFNCQSQQVENTQLTNLSPRISRSHQHLFLLSNESLFFSSSQLKSANINICIFCSSRNSCPPMLAMKKLRELLLISSIEYFDHLLVKNYAGNSFKKVYQLTIIHLQAKHTDTIFNVKPWQCALEDSSKIMINITSKLQK